jgi:hypothetical protein
VTIESKTDTFHGKPVREFRRGDHASADDVVYRLWQKHNERQLPQELLAELLAEVPAASLVALVIGQWSFVKPAPAGGGVQGFMQRLRGTWSNQFPKGPDAWIDALIARRDELAALRALFVGDITREESELSWIVQTRYAPLLDAFPALETLRIRGTEKLAAERYTHASLRELAIETAGLTSAFAASLAQSHLPSLRRLELWIGNVEYGADNTIAPYAELVEHIDPARLEYLGLRNSELSDDLAEYIAQQPWLGQLHTLDLSMGTLGDRGALALAASPHIAGLQRLDVRHHYIGDDAVAQLRALPLELVIGAAEEEDDGERYTQVTE